MDARVAQIVAFIWVSFMYSHVLPLMFPITLFNFFVIYWADKYLLLYFYKTPRNYDETSINYLIYVLRYAFIWHFVFGFLALSNNSILTSDSDKSLFSESVNVIQDSWFGS